MRKEATLEMDKFMEIVEDLKEQIEKDLNDVEFGDDDIPRFLEHIAWYLEDNYDCNL